MSKFPYLNIATNVPAFALEKICLAQQLKIEEWFKNKWQSNQPPVYGSVDLRNSGLKLTPVDMNLFPGGFNNISPQFIPLTFQALINFFAKTSSTKPKVLLIPENHTRNSAYLDNVYTLQDILHQSGIDSVIGSLDSAITKPTLTQLNNGKTMTYHPLVRDGKRIKTKSGFDPDVVLLNNDLSIGKPTILIDIEQTLLPPLNAGWYMRRKTNFFTEYNKVCEEFAQVVEIDPWQIDAYFDIGIGLDFANRVGLEELATKVDAMLLKIKLKYQKYQIKEEPYLIVKANNGTYGMGIMTVKSSAEILAINRRVRNKMAVIKDGQSVHDVIIQEGVYTIEEVKGKVAEPVVYMVDDAVVGGFYRVHPTKARDENLNAVGANFVPMTFATQSHALTEDKLESEPNRFYAYAVIARLALLASSMELAKYI